VFFYDGAAATHFIRWVKDHAEDFNWQDPRNENDIYDTRYRILPTPAEKVRGRALAPVWAFIDKRLEDSCRYTADMHIRTDTRRGKISVASDNDMWPIACIDNDSGEIHVNDESLTYFGWDRQQLMETTKVAQA
jgi:hypothetical protein